MKRERLEELQTNQIFKGICIKVVMFKGDKKKTISKLIPSYLLFTLDETYYLKCMEIDGYYSIGLDETYETFEGCEEFLMDFISGNKYDLNLKDKLSLSKLHSSLRHNKNIYKLVDYSFEIVNEASDLVKEYLCKNINFRAMNFQNLIKFDEDILMMSNLPRSICQKTNITIHTDDLENYPIKVLSKIGTFETYREAVIVVNKKDEKYVIEASSLYGLSILGLEDNYYHEKGVKDKYYIVTRNPDCTIGRK